MRRISKNVTGYAFNISLHEARDMFYGKNTAECFLTALSNLRFCGTLEYYGVNSGADTYLVGVGLRDDDKQDKGELFESLCLEVDEAMDKQGLGVRLNQEMSEMTTMFSIRASYLYRGSAQFREGVPVELREPEDGGMSHFEGVVYEAIQAGTQDR